MLDSERAGLMDNDEVRVTKEFGQTIYHYRGKKYDELSARHNGIIGMGAQLRKIIKTEAPRDENAFLNDFRKTNPDWKGD